MQNITLYGTVDKLTEIYTELETMAKNNGLKFQAEGDKSRWTSIHLKEKKLFGAKLEIEFVAKRKVQDAAFFQQHLQEMMNLLARIETEHDQAREQLMTMTRQVECGIGITTNSLEAFTPVLAVTTRKIQGFMFYQGIFYDPELVRLLDVEGNSDLEDATPQPEQLERKQRSETALQALGVKVLDRLPVLPLAQQTTLRSQEEVVQRAIALAIVAIKGETNDDALVQQVTHTYQANAFFSPLERKFLMQALPSDKERAQLTWRYESLWVLLWALGYVDTLDAPTQLCPVPEAVGYLREAGSFDKFMQGATLRSASEILEACDWIYRADWACMNALLKQQEPPAGFNGSVVYERHYALNWLINYQNQDWDHVTTDT